MWYFIVSRKEKTTETQKKKMICAVYGEGAVTDQIYQMWFAKFCSEDFLLDNALWSGRWVEVDSDQIQTLIEDNQSYTTQEIANILKVSKSSVENCLHQLGNVNHSDVWVPLKWKNLLDCISACDSLLKQSKNIPFLKQN